MLKALSKRQVQALIKRFLAEQGGRARGRRMSMAALNGCVVYRGGRTETVCENMSRADCEELSLRLQSMNSTYYAKPLQKPCEGSR